MTRFCTERVVESHTDGRRKSTNRIFKTNGNNGIHRAYAENEEWTRLEAPDQRLLEALLNSWDRNNTILIRPLEETGTQGL